jgi:hypothetical protein
MRRRSGTVPSSLGVREHKPLYGADFVPTAHPPGRTNRCEEIIAKAEALAEQQRQDVATATKRADHLVAELFEATSELLEMSKREGASNGRSEGLKSPEVREYSM